MDLIFVGVFFINIYLFFDSLEIILNYTHYELKGLMSINRIRLKYVNSFLKQLGTFKYNKVIVFVRLFLSILVIFFSTTNNYWLVLSLLFIIELYLRFVYVESVSGANGIILYSLFIYSLYFSFKNPKILHLISYISWENSYSFS